MELIQKRCFQQTRFYIRLNSRVHSDSMEVLLFATWQSEYRNDDDKDVESDVGDVAHRRSDRTQTDNTRTNRNILLRVRKTYFPKEK